MKFKIILYLSIVILLSCFVLSVTDIKANSINSTEINATDFYQSGNRVLDESSADEIMLVVNSSEYWVNESGDSVLNLEVLNDLTVDGLLIGTVGGIDMRGDPWYLAGTNFQVTDNITSDWIFANIPSNYVQGLNNTINILMNNSLEPKSSGLSSEKSLLLLHLNENDIDSTGNVNGITSSGVTYEKGQYGSGAYFDGSAGYIQLDSGSDVSINGDDFSVTLWFNTTQTTSVPAHGPRMIGKHEYGQYGAWTLGLGQTGAIGKIESRASTTIGGNAYLWTATTTGTYNDGKWHQVVLTRDATDSATGIKIYIDGELETTQSQTLGDLTNPYKVTLGADNGGNEVRYEGMLDEVRVYNRTLNPVEVRDLFRQDEEGVDDSAFVRHSGDTINNFLRVKGEIVALNSAGEEVIRFDPDGQSFIQSDNGLIINGSAEYLEAEIYNQRDPKGNAGFSFKIKGQEYKIGTNVLDEFRILDNSTNNKIVRFQKGMVENALYMEGRNMSIGGIENAIYPLHVNYYTTTGNGVIPMVVIDRHSTILGDGSAIRFIQSTDSKLGFDIYSQRTGATARSGLFFEYYGGSGETLGMVLNHSGDLEVYQGINITGLSNANEYCIAGDCITGWSDIQSSSNLSIFFGKTTLTYDGKLSNLTHNGYEVGNLLCSNEYTGTHFCQETELIDTFHQRSVGTIAEWEGFGWYSAGAQKYAPATIPFNDCNGWGNATPYYGGNFWKFNTNSSGAVTCDSEKSLACCKVW